MQVTFLLKSGLDSFLFPPSEAKIVFEAEYEYFIRLYTFNQRMKENKSFAY